MSDNVDSLRAILFDTLRGVKSGSVSVDKAKSINETAQSIINTAKVEVEYLKVTGQKAMKTKFLAPQTDEVRQTATGTLSEKIDPVSGTRSVVHTLGG